MKRPVSLVASLGLALVLASACGGAKAGKVELTEICLDRMGGSKSKCSCRGDRKGARSRAFARVAQGAYDNRRFSGMVPVEVRRDPMIGAALQTATMSCFV